MDGWMDRDLGDLLKGGSGFGFWVIWVLRGVGRSLWV